MRRWIVMLLIATTAGSVWAQDDPPPPTPTLAPIAVPTNTPIPTPVTPSPTPLPDVRSALPSDDQTAATLLGARSDIEVLANAVLGAADRPTGWTGTYDIENPQMAFDARLDLEILADAALNGTRPDGWFGIQPSSEYSIARDIRHDLELLADVTVERNVRPPNWLGDNPLMRCNRSTQTLALLLETRGIYTPTTPLTSPNYCFDLMLEVSTYTEINLLDQSNVVQAADNAPAEAAVAVNIIGDAAVGYYDRGATQPAGAIPAGEVVQPVARSYAQFSRMTLVRGDGFELFVDSQDTTLTPGQFEVLGDVNVISVNTMCRPTWCEPAP